MSLYLSTLFKAKADLGLADTTDDAILTQWMEGLQGRIADYCQREFLRQENRVDLLTGEGGSLLLLPVFPIETIVSVKMDSDRDFDNTAALVEDMDFVVRASRGILVTTPDWRWPEAPNCIQVVYTAGYVAAGSSPAAGQLEVPAGLQGVFLLQLGFEWRNRLNLGKSQVNAQGVSVNLATAEFLPAVRDGLAPYRRIS